MGYGRVWVIRHMGYDRVDCTTPSETRHTAHTCFSVHYPIPLPSLSSTLVLIPSLHIYYSKPLSFKSTRPSHRHLSKLHTVSSPSSYPQISRSPSSHLEVVDWPFIAESCKFERLPPLTPCGRHRPTRARDRARAPTHPQPVPAPRSVPVSCEAGVGHAGRRGAFQTCRG